MFEHDKKIKAGCIIVIERYHPFFGVNPSDSHIKSGLLAMVVKTYRGMFSEQVVAVDLMVGGKVCYVHVKDFTYRHYEQLPGEIDHVSCSINIENP